MSPKEVLEFAKKNDAKQLDLRFTDIPSLQHHVSYPIAELDESSFEDGFGMDGSSIRGWAAINESDMLLIPDPGHRLHGPVRRNPHAGDDGDVKDPITKQRYERDPRWIAQKAELYLKNSGIGRHGVFRRGSRVLHLRQHQLRPEPALRASTSSTPRRAAGTRAAGRTIWATGRATRKATSRCRRPITIRICAARWCRP